MNPLSQFDFSSLTLSMNHQQQSHSLQYVQNISTSILPSMHQIFNFSQFNEMQSKMFNFCYECQENFVLSSPTASGKTVIAALCFLKSKKCVYVAPTKALIQNHLQEFTRMRFKAGALTSENSCDLTSELILTTPEKLEQLLIQNTISPDCVVFDEVQTAFTERGWLYEVCFQLLKKNKKRIVCLTASYCINQVFTNILTVSYFNSIRFFQMLKYLLLIDFSHMFQA
ncbi:RNA_helicase [Hexamita inflata]|uniref:RNA_helicase n=1 Tax=Hexamita inflata TaxID=28002 RepID=A0ABP1J286_9EUKA